MLMGVKGSAGLTVGRSVGRAVADGGDDLSRLGDEGTTYALATVGSIAGAAR
jgi:hypothetical protein